LRVSGMLRDHEVDEERGRCEEAARAAKSVSLH